MIETMLEEAAIELSLHLILIWISCSSIFFEVRNATETKHKITFDPRWKSGRRQSRCEHRGGEPMTP